MAIPFKSSITLGQIFAQNDDFRVLSNSKTPIYVNGTNKSLYLGENNRGGGSFSTNWSIVSIGAGYQSTSSLLTLNTSQISMDYGGSNVLLGTSAKTTLGYAGRVTEIAGSTLTLECNYGTLTLQDSQATMSAGHYGAGIIVDDTYGIRINNSNYTTRNNALYLGPLNIANDADKTITNRYSTDNDTGVYAPEPTYGDIYSWDVNKKFNIATTGWVLDRIAAWQRIQVMQLNNTNAYSNTLSGNVSSDYYLRTWCFLINVYHRPTKVWYCAPISVQPFPNTTAKSEVYVNGSKKVVTLTVGSGTNITVSINDNSQTDREYNYNLLPSNGFCI